MTNAATAEAQATSGDESSGEEAVIAARLREAILDQRLVPGTKLTEAELAAIFTTTRARIRRVLLSLAQEKIITLFPGRGAFVAAPTQAEATEVLAARRLVEVGLLEQLAAPPGSAPAVLRDIVAAETAAAGRHDRTEMIRLSGAFHVALAQWLGNAVVAEILAELVLRSSLAIALYERSEESCCLPSDHMALIDRLGSGQVTAAASLMRDHLGRIEQRLDFSRAPGERLLLREILRC